MKTPQYFYEFSFRHMNFFFFQYNCLWLVLASLSSNLKMVRRKVDEMIENSAETVKF
jgi:hypothetical protein